MKSYSLSIGEKISNGPKVDIESAKRRLKARKKRLAAKEEAKKPKLVLV